MKKRNIRMVASVVEILVGAALLMGNMLGKVDSYWSGMGSALIAVGAIFLFRQIRYRTNESYRECVDVEVNDERNKFLATRAWAWAGYLFVLTAAVASLVLKVIGQDALSVAAGMGVCAITVFYWLSYMYLRKKY